ncbi:MAG: hypothetical protein A2176_07165 [Spirochaetes bacterium RBG_13_51_14]|nr:MAG: hypothetical protein A2176_07165 [Spirochaetes bacterium RBG_13_51_14]
MTAASYGDEPTVGQDAGLPSKKNGRFELENGFERYFFYTKYRIGGKTYSRDGVFLYHFPISELKFPLEAFFFYANLNLTVVERLTIHFNVRKNIQNKAGVMKDSDWFPFPGLKTVYSESDVRLNAVITDADLSVRLFTVSFFSMRLGAGFMHQYLYFWCSNTEQVSLLNPARPYIKLPCKTITYEVQYYISTLQITPVFTVLDRLEIMLAIRFSPYLKARDIDDHIIRAKKSTGDSAGTAFMPFLRLRYLFSNRIFITAKLEYLYLQTKGDQTQSYYLPVYEADYIPGWSARTKIKLKSEQLSVSLGAGYSFEF